MASLSFVNTRGDKSNKNDIIMKIGHWLYSMVLLLVCLGGMPAHAQTAMSDDQVAQFVLKEKAAGVSDAQIASKLVTRGVNIEQLRRVRQSMQQGAKQHPNTTGTHASQQNKRTRENNGDTPESTTIKSASNEYTTQQRSVLPSAQKQREDALLMQEEIEDIMPDTARLYLRLLEQQKAQKRKVFGRDIFNNKELSFEPNMNIATPNDYVLGPGDAVFVDIYGASQKNIESTVSPEGSIQIDGYGPVNVGGMTVAAATAKLRATVGQRYQGSQIRLSVGQTKTISVNIAGEVKTPGTYTLSAFATVFNALYMAGGINDIGTLRNIKVYRGGRLISTVDVYAYIMYGKLAGNIRLAANDMIVVGPYEGLVNVSGKVKRPMYYEVKRNESLSTVIDYAGGFAGDAYQKSIRVIRKSTGAYSVHTLGEFERGTFQMTDGDSVFVDSTLSRFENMVEVKGAVFRPGTYSLGAEVNTVRELLTRADGLTEDAIVTRGVLHRRREDRTLEVIALDVKGILERRSPDMGLKNEDVLFIPSRKELQEARTLTISGEVMHPGIYDYAERTTIEDLVLQAGGLTDAASVVKVDVARRIRERTAEETSNLVARTYTLSLKDGFVVEGEPGFVLEPYDEVFVRKSPAYSEQKHVRVEGEITFEGIYTLSEKGQRLSELVVMAGGLTPEAYAKGARLVRELTPEELEQQRNLIKQLAAADTTVQRRLQEIEPVRNVGINLDMAMQYPGDDRYDLVLRQGDRLIVPQYNNTVYVNGAVMLPNTIAYRQNAGLSYYINAAGGFSNTARKGKVFVVHPNGTVSRVRSAKDIEPGSQIVVPERAARRSISLAEMLGIGGTLASIAAVIVTLLK